MTKTRPRFLLLQARNDDDEMALHELRCFIDTLQVPADTIVTHNLLHGVPPEALWREADAILMGGSGDYTLVKPIPVLTEALGFLERVVLSGSIPTFASCFGFQALVVAGGGRLVYDPSMSEVGTYELTLTEAGKGDPLFGPLPDPFKVQLGHKDSAVQLPRGMIALAQSARVGLQALRVEGIPVVATQFHPELSKQTNTDRYLRYWERQGDSTVEDDPVLQSMADSPDASALLRRWMTAELVPWLATNR